MTALPIGTVVRATRQIVDEQDPHETWSDEAIAAWAAYGGGAPVAAELGTLGRVLHAEGDQLTVIFDGAPAALDVFLGDDVAPFMTLVQGGLA